MSSRIVNSKRSDGTDAIHPDLSKIGISMSFSASRFIVSTLAGLLFSLTPSLALAKAPTAKTLLWEISGNGLAKPSFLFGTYHEACLKVINLNQQHKRSLRQVKQLYLESSDDDPMSDMLQLMVIPNKQKLSDILTAEEQTKVKNFFEGSLKTSFSNIQEIRPFFLSLFIEAKRPKPKDTCQKTSSEALLSKEARKYRLSRGNLETAADVVKALNAIPMRDEVAILIGMIDELQPAAGQTINWTKYNAEASIVEARLYRLYTQQDINAIYDFSTKDPKATSSEQKFTNILLGYRNQLWIPRMQKAMKSKTTFFGVGAGHLGGESGLVSLLEKAGYTVRPVMNRK